MTPLFVANLGGSGIDIVDDTEYDTGNTLNGDVIYGITTVGENISDNGTFQYNISGLDIKELLSWSGMGRTDPAVGFPVQSYGGLRQTQGLFQSSDIGGKVSLVSVGGNFSNITIQVKTFSGENMDVFRVWLFYTKN